MICERCQKRMCPNLQVRGECPLRTTRTADMLALAQECHGHDQEDRKERDGDA